MTASKKPHPTVRELRDQLSALLHAGCPPDLPVDTEGSVSDSILELGRAAQLKSVTDGHTPSRGRTLEELLTMTGAVGYVQMLHAELARSRAEGFREAAQMVAAKSDLLRGTRGGVKRACCELDLTARDLMEQAGESRGHTPDCPPREKR